MSLHFHQWQCYELDKCSFVVPERRNHLRNLSSLLVYGRARHLLIGDQRHQACDGRGEAGGQQQDGGHEAAEAGHDCVGVVRSRGHEAGHDCVGVMSRRPLPLPLPADGEAR